MPTAHSLHLAFSPCPNDTFVFHALVHGLVPGAPGVEVSYADVDVTNTAAQRGGLADPRTGQVRALDLVKVSYAALPWLLDTYELLPCGGALGRGCGPLVLVRDASIASLSGRSVAVPGDRTTAYLLMRLWSAQTPPASVTVVPFAEIMPAVAAGRFDAGLVIHEARFTYRRHGLRALV
ncbi:MAG TPA: MqnA/MqnD/SBP family protein, partial [Micromonosporaceae bacterium]